MKVIEKLTQNPEAVAIGAICLLLGPGDGARCFSPPRPSGFGIRRMMVRPPVPRLPKLNIRFAFVPELPRILSLP